MDVFVNGESYELTLIDTAGQEDYDKLRALSYESTDVFLVCFSIVEPDSFSNVKEKVSHRFLHNCIGRLCVDASVKYLSARPTAVPEFLCSNPVQEARTCGKRCALSTKSHDCVEKTNLLGLVG